MFLCVIFHRAVLFKLHLEEKVCAPLKAGCVGGVGEVAGKGEDPWKEMGRHPEEEAAWGGHKRSCAGEAAPLEGNVEEASSQEVEEPTLEEDTAGGELTFTLACARCKDS